MPHNFFQPDVRGIFPAVVGHPDVTNFGLVRRHIPYNFVSIANLSQSKLPCCVGVRRVESGKLSKGL